MKKRIKQIIGVIIGIIIGISTTVGATTIFNSKDITYSSDKTSKTNVKDSLDELYTNLGKCPEGLSCVNLKLNDIAELGDYIKMTPTSTLYTVSKDLTGSSRDQTINPSELNLWRVIKKNEDGTIEVVSEYVPSGGISFFGKMAYINFIGVLNQVAAQYTNDKYVAKTRHMGYSNQVEYCENITNCLSDTGYKEDLETVESALGTLAPKTFGTTNHYWLASRGTRSEGKCLQYIRDGALACGDTVLTNSGLEGSSGSRPRPILTLKADVKIKNGSGKSESTAYVLD